MSNVLSRRPGFATRRAAVVISAITMIMTLSGALSGAAKPMIALGDLNWQGLWAFPTVGTMVPGGPGSTSYSSGALAVRYVGLQRRFLVPTFTTTDPTTGQTFGDLVEWQAPSAQLYTGPNPMLAPTLVETRRWKDWTSLRSTPTWQSSNGVRIGGLYWDEANGVLWYSAYGYYQSRNTPILGAVQLLDTVDGALGGQYRTVGTKSGPWWFRNNDPNDQNLVYWKSVYQWIVPVPSSAQIDLGNRQFLMGAATGSVPGQGNLGPGFQALNLPALSAPPNSVLANGLHLADYTSESTQTPPHAWRDTNYRFYPGPPEVLGGLALDSSGTGLYNPSGGHGFWQMSQDNVNCFAWVETPTREGILMFGRIVHGGTWYGLNPRWSTPGSLRDPPNTSDPTRGLAEASNSYASEIYNGALYGFDPAQVREVGRGARSPYSNGINPILLGDWHTQWPNIPMNKDDLSGTGVSPPISSNASNSCYWDSRASELIWVQPSSVDSQSARPTMMIFTIGPSGAPSSPRNLRIVR